MGDIKAEITGVETAEVSVVAAVVTILDHVHALFVATKNKKSITKTMICCVVMCMRMGKFDPDPIGWHCTKTGQILEWSDSFRPT